MADPNYNMLFQAPNAGAAFADAFQQGLQKRREDSARNALAALVQNPNDPQALSTLARVDPERALTFRQQQLKYGSDQHDEWAKVVGNAAKMATTPEQWDAIVDQFVANGHPEAAQLKGKFSPALRAAFMAQGGVSDDTPQDPSMIREFDIATQRGLVPPGTTYEQYVQLRSPSINAPVTIPYNSTVTGGGAPANLPTVSTPEEAMMLPPGTQFRMPDGRIGTVPGGAGGNASGGFPTGGQ